MCVLRCVCHCACVTVCVLRCVCHCVCVTVCVLRCVRHCVCVTMCVTVCVTVYVTVCVLSNCNPRNVAEAFSKHRLVYLSLVTISMLSTHSFLYVLSHTPLLPRMMQY